ncbi:LysM domain-containing protein [Tibeticola sp.]|jgi:hypothetical protein|uniref:LysM peptidoglycan-binding domain-containing protein n=1 Tax=Tibeticola sp. TaxID=2005368 RepID=UPI00258B0477|nr:LysM domain-containing protein [Tibeticola sp.]
MKPLPPTDLTEPTMPRRQALSALALLASAWVPAAAWGAGNYPITPGQKRTAAQVAERGVPLDEIAPNAPDQYTVQRGDTLWAISGLYLKRPWRWPELWGMNLADIRNPHLIYPGQVLRLVRRDGRAMLETPSEPPLVKLSPRVRAESLADAPIPTLPPHLIEPFLAEPVVLDEKEFESAPRIVATRENSVLLSRGDLAYARGPAGKPLSTDPGEPKAYRVYRDLRPLKDPASGEILGYEAQFVGRARLQRGESVSEAPGPDGKPEGLPVPATIEIVSAKEEIRTGDRLLPEPERSFRSYAPHAPAGEVDARIVSVYGSAVRFAAQNQVVTINRGIQDGIDTGTVLAVLSAGARVVDRGGPEGPTELRLPDERNGLLMVFLPFERVSYALLLQIADGVKVGDRVVQPR